MIIPIPKKSQEKPLSTHLRLRSSFTPDSGVNICFKVVSGTFYRRSLGDGGSLRSSRCRRSRVRAAHATCAACMRALPARLCRRDKVCWWQAVRCSAAAARGQLCLEAARSRRVLDCTLEPAWILRLRVGLGCRPTRQTHFAGCPRAHRSLFAVPL